MACYWASFTFFTQLVPTSKATLNLRITALELKQTYEQAGQPHILVVTIPEDFALLGRYVAYVDSSLLSFRDNLLVPSSTVKQSVEP
jgi:hypothetical protein